MDLGEVREQRREVARLGRGRACGAKEEDGGAERGGAGGAHGGGLGLGGVTWCASAGAANWALCLCQEYIRGPNASPCPELA